MLQSFTPDVPSPSARWLRWLIRLRYVLLSLYVLAAIAVVWDLFFASSSFLMQGGTLGHGAIGWKTTAIFTTIFLLAPALFLLGIPHLRLPYRTRGRWIGITMTVGALWAALISVGIGAAIFSLAFPKTSFGDALSSASKTSLGLLGIIAVPWAGWLLFFSIVWVGEWVVVFRRLYRLLLAGTMLELLITIPIDVQVRKRTQCYCDEGTFLALTIGITMAFCTFGPGLLLLFLARRTQRLNPGLCASCGYDLRGRSSLRCPECGKIIRHGSIAPKSP